MALYQLRTTIDRSAVAQDPVVWGLFGIDTVLNPADIIDDIRDAWLNAFGNNTQGGPWVLDHFFVSVEAYPAAGGPAAGYSAIEPPEEMGSSAGLPAECAVVVSHEVNTARGLRPVGRTYCGPLGVDWGGERPASGFAGFLGACWVEFHEAVEVLGPTPVVISKFLDGAPRAPVGLPIVRYSIDDAFDTQRRRGWERTTKTTFTPA